MQFRKFKVAGVNKGNLRTLTVQNLADKLDGDFTLDKLSAACSALSVSNVGQRFELRRRLAVCILANAAQP